MGGNMCVFQRKKYDEEKKELTLQKVPRKTMRKEAIVNEITREGVTKHPGEGTNQLGKTNEEREESILSVPSTSTNSDSIDVESEEVTTDTSSLTSSSMIRSNIKANIICERCLLQNSYGHICDFTREHRRGRSSPPLGEANRIALNKSASFGGTLPHSYEIFRDLSEFIWTEREDVHLGNYLKGGTNYPSETSHSQGGEICSAWGGGGSPLDGGVSTRKDNKRTTNGKAPRRRTTDESILILEAPTRSGDNSSSVRPTKWGKRGKSLDLPSWGDKADYKRGGVPLTKCNSGFFNNRGAIIYS
ncbi:conserved Plasmodium protein, unknown function [Plasmodium vivax]|nr:conserved Plasmodium protein, unknown function [Plasmodium vivax]